jgi:hypothetical protein
MSESTENFTAQHEAQTNKALTVTCLLVAAVLFALGFLRVENIMGPNVWFILGMAALASGVVFLRLTAADAQARQEG